MSAPSSLMTLLVIVGAACEPAAPEKRPSARSQEIARYAVTTYGEPAIGMLADLVAFKTVHIEGTENAENREFRAMTAYLEERARQFGLDFEDRGAVVIFGLGHAAERLGIVTHADVQPAAPAKWAQDPFSLDADSEPGRLVGRGAEDDKGPLACALYAMRALEDRGLPLTRRIELIVTYTEESDWDPIRAFLAEWEAPQINVAFDAEYPVVIAEKGWGEVLVTLPEVASRETQAPTLERFTGGSFLSQVPEDAVAEIGRASGELEAALREAVGEDAAVTFTIEHEDSRLTLRAHGVAAHSASPWEGKNAITHLAALLGRFEWPESSAARAVDFINDLVGTGDYAEKFGDLAHSHPFMGPLTLTLAKLEPTADEGEGLTAGISFRRPVGRSQEEVEAAVVAAIEGWQERAGAPELSYEMEVWEPYLVEGAPHVPVLLDVFRHYTGIDDAQPISMGGGTNVRLLPYGVTFGPSMPGVPYTGHSEHEFITRDQFLLNLEMYTAVLAELAAE